ncbi:hypothetical protein Golob_023811 [Gossypium lobatum]|uniref:Uncharacterized protein n=1 Tax=Gossypium lobatum TaxID=34289 RepID=A0A7J8NGA2_9ROSI|nr:hypothetical protein [Gossypium lobatum]
MIWALWNRGYHDGITHTSLKVISFIHSYLRDLTALDATVGATVGSRAESWHLAIEPSFAESYFLGDSLTFSRKLYSKTEDRSEISALIKEGFRLAYGQFSVERVPSEIESVVATKKWWVDPPD